MTISKACLFLLILIVIMMLFLFGLLYFNSSISNFNNPWLDTAVERVFDIIKVLCGAMAGLVSANVIKAEKAKEQASASPRD